MSTFSVTRMENDAKGLPVVLIEGPDGARAVVSFQRTMCGHESSQVRPSYFGAVRERYGDEFARRVLAAVDEVGAA